MRALPANRTMWTVSTLFCAPGQWGLGLGQENASRQSDVERGNVTNVVLASVSGPTCWRHAVVGHMTDIYLDRDDEQFTG